MYTDKCILIHNTEISQQYENELDVLGFPVSKILHINTTRGLVCYGNVIQLKK